jgi:hypothetical protein
MRGRTDARIARSETRGTSRRRLALAEEKRWGNYERRILANVYLMLVRAAHGETAHAIASLRTDLADAERKGAKSMAFEVALAPGEVEFRAGCLERRPRLLKLEQEIKAQEFFRTARLAGEALDRNSAAATPVK